MRPCRRLKRPAGCADIATATCPGLSRRRAIHSSPCAARLVTGHSEDGHGTDQVEKSAQCHDVHQGLPWRRRRHGQGWLGTDSAQLEAVQGGPCMMAMSLHACFLSVVVEFSFPILMCAALALLVKLFYSCSHGLTTDENANVHISYFICLSQKRLRHSTPTMKHCGRSALLVAGLLALTVAAQVCCCLFGGGE